MQNIINYYNIFSQNYHNLLLIIIGSLVLILALLFKNKLSKLILNIVSKLIFKGDDAETKKQSLKESLHKPLSFLFIVIAAFIAVYINYQSSSVIKVFKICVILILCWAIVNYLSNNLFLLFHFGENADNKMNTTAIRFISNILKVIVIAFAVVMVISELGYNINGLLTGIGVGGLAVSLAAQDAVSNLIAGFVIVFEKPFIVGDFIETSSIAGVVEEVSMRSTMIRTIEDSVVTVPNSKLTNDAIVNISRMDKRLISLDFGLIYSTPNELMQKCIDDIKAFLTQNNDIIPSPLRVNFSKLDDSSLNINVTCYTSKVNMNEYLSVYNDVNFSIKKIIEENNAEFAFPSTSIYIERS